MGYSKISEEKVIILITDPFNRKSFDLFNIIKKKYPLLKPVILNQRNNFFDKIKIRLLYFSGLFILRKNNFENDLKKILKKFSRAEIVYIPIEEDITLLFYEFVSKNFYRNLRFLLPDKYVFEMVRNKEMFLKFCISNDFIIPKIYSKKDFNSLKKNFRPLVIKPKLSSGAVGLKFLNIKKDLDILDKIEFNKFLLQEKINNSSKVFGAFFLFDKGKMISYYGHERIRTYPLTGGVTLYSKICFNEKLKEIGRRLLEKLNWSGFAMIEFLYDSKDDKFKIIELNPRVWGSFLISEFADTCFFENYINLSLNKTLKHCNVRKDVFIRWFSPFDILVYFKKKGKINNFFKIDRKNVCYINFTYSNLYKSILFFVLSFINLKTIKKIVKKLF
jgi:hypothetical protein